MKIVLLSLLLATFAHAQLYSLDLFEGVGDDGIDLSFSITQSNDVLDLLITNDSTVRSVITQIAFEDLYAILPSLPVLDAWSVNNSVNISGSNNIDFSTTLGLEADPPPTRNGINSGEELLISLGGVDYNSFIQALDSGDLRLAVHAQGIGENEISSSYVNTPEIKPEPSTSMLGAVGITMIVLRRNRTS